MNKSILSISLIMGLGYCLIAGPQENKPTLIETRNLHCVPSIIEIVKRLNPTVVAITNTSSIKVQRKNTIFSTKDKDEYDKWYSENGDENIQKLMAGGSGVIISSDGKILTNFHVVDGLSGGEVTLEVKTIDGKIYNAVVLGKDKEIDIALIKIEATHLPFAVLGNSDTVKMGEIVVAIGNPLGLQHTATQGIISAKGRKLSGALESFLQTDAAINHGNSGGPLFNLRGEVIGINTAILPNGQNLGFAVPINMVKHILPKLKLGKSMGRGFLGITSQDLDIDFQTSSGVKKGVVVGDIWRGKAAEKGGLLRLDIIIAINGQKVLSPEDLTTVISNHTAGETITISIIRDSKPMKLIIILGNRDELESNN